MFGIDVYYLRRELINKHPVFLQDPESCFSSAQRLAVYLDSLDTFEGEGDLISKIGQEIRDEVVFTLSRAMWESIYCIDDRFRDGDNPPREGDIVYFPLLKSLFQIAQVEHDIPFYQVQNYTNYKIHAFKFEYSGEKMTVETDDEEEACDPLFVATKEDLEELKKGRQILSGTATVTDPNRPGYDTIYVQTPEQREEDRLTEYEHEDAKNTQDWETYIEDEDYLVVPNNPIGRTGKTK